MMYMQSNSIYLYEQQLMEENRIRPTHDNYFGLLGIQEEIKGNYKLASQYYYSSNHPIAIKRYLIINNLQLLTSGPQPQMQFHAPQPQMQFHAPQPQMQVHAPQPQIQVHAHNQAQVNIQLAQPQMTQSQATQHQYVVPPPISNTSVIKAAKQKNIPTTTAKDCAKTLNKDLIDFLYELKEISKNHQHIQKSKLAVQKGVPFEQLDSVFKRCKKRGLVGRWPSISAYGRDVLAEYEILMAEQTSNKPILAKAILHMRDMQQARDRTNNAAQAPQAEAQAIAPSVDRMSLKFLTS